MNYYLQRNLAVGIILLPMLIFLYYLLQPYQSSQHTTQHFYYIAASSAVALLVGILAYREYRRTNYLKVYLLAIGFIGLAILYGIHDLVTPGNSIVVFPMMQQHINAFVFFGDMSRLWISLAFIPQTFIVGKDHKKQNWISIALISLIIIALSFIMLMYPSSFPEVKYESGIDTYFAVIVKVITIIFMSITVTRYFEGWRILRNVSLLSFIVGAALIAETPIIFMLSRPWGQAWWLAHNIYLVSFLIIGCGIYYSGKYKEIEFFDVYQQVNDYVQKIKQQKLEIGKMNASLEKELKDVGEIQKKSMLDAYSDDNIKVVPIYIPKKYVSGDSYDYVWDNDQSRFSGIIYDVMGHGVITALQTSALKVFFRQSVFHFPTLSKQLSWINKEVMKIGDERFIAALVFEFNFKTNILRVASAGITYYFKVSQDDVMKVKIRGMYLGILANPEFDEEIESIGPQDCYYFASDGLYDSFEGLISSDLEETIDKIKSLNGSDRKDDLTALCVKII